MDQGNVPLGLYAAAALAPDGAPLEQLLAWVEVVATGGTALSREALGIARTLASTLAASDSVDRLNDVIRERERAESLRQDLTRLARAPTPS